jgi:hypothetical protein
MRGVGEIFMARSVGIRKEAAEYEHNIESRVSGKCFRLRDCGWWLGVGGALRFGLSVVE